MQVLKTSGKPVAASLCIGPKGDMHGVSPGECAVRLVKAGTQIYSHMFSFSSFCEPYHIRALAQELAPERGIIPAGSEKHGMWGSGLEMHTKPWVRAR